jgi:CRISPR-associated protein Cas2
MSRSRPLHLVAYDISDARRLARVLDIVKAYSTGGQKSVHECFLSPGEIGALRTELGRTIEATEDSVLFLRLDPRQGIQTLGRGVAARDTPFFYIG